MYRTIINAPLGAVPTISPRAEVILLLLITIISIIGLSVCLGAYGESGDLTSAAAHAQIGHAYDIGQTET